MCGLTPPPPYPPRRYSLNFIDSSKGVIDAMKAATRIITTPMPFAYARDFNGFDTVDEKIKKEQCSDVEGAEMGRWAERESRE